MGHIDQLRATDIKPQKTVSFAPDSSTHPSPTQSESHLNMGDIVEVPISQPNRNDKRNTIEQSGTDRTDISNGNVKQSERLHRSTAQLRRSERIRKPPSYLQDYVKK